MTDKLYPLDYEENPPGEPGWYATVHSWGENEGWFPGAHRWDGKRWVEDEDGHRGTSATVLHWKPRFETAAEADKFAWDNDPEW